MLHTEDNALVNMLWIMQDCRIAQQDCLRVQACWDVKLCQCSITVSSIVEAGNRKTSAITVHPMTTALHPRRPEASHFQSQPAANYFHDQVPELHNLQHISLNWLICDKISYPQKT
jgi:hypothetical protein